MNGVRSEESEWKESWRVRVDQRASKSKILYGEEPLVENLLPLLTGSIIYCSNATEVAQWAAPVAVDHKQLRTMASEIVDPIDWRHLHMQLLTTSAVRGFDPGTFGTQGSHMC